MLADDRSSKAPKPETVNTELKDMYWFVRRIALAKGNILGAPNGQPPQPLQALVDLTSTSLFSSGPVASQHKSAASSELYRHVGIDGDPHFPGHVVLAFKHNVDARYNLYLRNGKQHHIIHVAFPHREDHEWGEEQAEFMHEVAALYKTVFKELCTTPCDRLRLVPIGRDHCPERFRDSMPGITYGGLVAGFNELTADEQDTVMKQLFSLDLFIPDSDEAKMYEVSLGNVLAHLEDLNGWTTPPFEGGAEEARREAHERLLEEYRREVERAQAQAAKSSRDGRRAVPYDGGGRPLSPTGTEVKSEAGASGCAAAEARWRGAGSEVSQVARSIMSEMGSAAQQPTRGGQGGVRRGASRSSQATAGADSSKSPVAAKQERTEVSSAAGAATAQSSQAPQRQGSSRSVLASLGGSSSMSGPAAKRTHTEASVVDGSGSIASEEDPGCTEVLSAALVMAAAATCGAAGPSSATRGSFGSIPSADQPSASRGSRGSVASWKPAGSVGSKVVSAKGTNVHSSVAAAGTSPDVKQAPSAPGSSDRSPSWRGGSMSRASGELPPQKASPEGEKGRQFVPMNEGTDEEDDDDDTAKAGLLQVGDRVEAIEDFKTNCEVPLEVRKWMLGVVTEVDAAGDFVINFRNFDVQVWVWPRNIHKLRVLPKPEPTEADKSKCDRLFQFFDVDKDGYLNFAETYCMAAALADAHLTKEEFQLDCAFFGCNPDKGLDLEVLLRSYIDEGGDIDKALRLLAEHEKASRKEQPDTSGGKGTEALSAPGSASAAPLTSTARRSGGSSRASGGGASSSGLAIDGLADAAAAPAAAVEPNVTEVQSETGVFRPRHRSAGAASSSGSADSATRHFADPGHDDTEVLTAKGSGWHTLPSGGDPATAEESPSVVPSSALPTEQQQTAPTPLSPAPSSTSPKEQQQKASTHSSAAPSSASPAQRGAPTPGAVKRVVLDADNETALRSIKWGFGKESGASVMRLGSKFKKESSDLAPGDVLLAVNGVDVRDMSKDGIMKVWSIQQESSTWMTLELAAAPC